MNFVCIVFELGDKMLTLSSMENLIVPCNLSVSLSVCLSLLLSLSLFLNEYLTAAQLHTPLSKPLKGT